VIMKPYRLEDIKNAIVAAAGKPKGGSGPWLMEEK
jgi:hypothetical protein